MLLDLLLFMFDNLLDIIHVVQLFVTVLLLALNEVFFLIDVIFN